jgi:putative ABC transport system substrate-binding protein
MTRLPAPGRALVELNVDIICTAGTPATLAAKHATTTIPLVFARVLFPERTGLVSSLARPGGNLTGVTFIGPEYAKRLELLSEVVPKLSRVALLYNDKNSASVMAKNETQEAANSLHVAFEPLGVHDRLTFDAAFTAMRRRRPDALMTTADSLISSNRALIVEFAAKHRVPSMYGDRAYVRDGGLMFYGTSTTEMWRHAATLVDRILRGAKPAELPVEQPTKFELVINLKTAKALGLTIPQSILQRADEVIQ